MKKVLVLGGTGFLGRNLCERLLSEGYIVKIYSRGHKKVNFSSEYSNQVEWIVSNFDAESAWDRILTDVDVVFHLICDTNPANNDVKLEFEKSVLPTISLLEKIKGKKIKLIFFSSGGTVYGIPKCLPILESHATDPISPYGIQKLCIEKLIEYYGRTYGLDYIILRISNPYGPYQNPLSNQGAIAVFFAKIYRHEKIQLWGDGQVIRDYIYVDDVINVCDKIIDYNGLQRVFNISSGMGISLNEIILAIEEVLECSASVEYYDNRIHDVTKNILDNSLAKKELSWVPKTDINSGIRNMKKMWDMSKMMFVKN